MIAPTSDAIAQQPGAAHSSIEGASGAGTLLLETKGLSKHYPGVDALVDVDFELRPGEVHALFGENGAGKSTLISILAGANTPTRGEIRFRGAPLVHADVGAARARGISAVFQEFSLVPQLTIAENLFLGDEPVRHGFLDRRNELKRARELLERLGFALDADRRVQELSRAEQQMVEIAKAFRGDLSVLILDEPTASLTERETESLFALINQAKAKGGPVDARIVTTTSVSGIYGNIGQTNYGAAKAGIASFTVIAARELGRYGITVNSISPSAFTRMTEDLRNYTEEDKETRSPKWIAPVATWLVSEESREITGRVFQAGNGQFAVAEGWHKGPESKPILDPREAGKILTELAKKARRNAGMNGLDLD